MKNSNLHLRLLHPSRWPIAIKLLFAFLITGMLPVILTGYYGVRLAMNNAQAQQLHVLEKIASSAAQQFSAMSDAEGRALDTASWNRTLSANAPATSDGDSLISVRLLDAQGAFIGDVTSGKLADWLNNELLQTILNNKNAGTVSYQSRVNGQDELLAYSALMPQGYRVIVVERGDGWIRPIRQELRDALEKVLMVALIAALFAYLYFNREIILPIRALTQSAKAVRAGDYSMVKSPSIQDDEIGEFADTFNTMLQGIQARERERDIFGRMVSYSVREQLLNGQIKLGGESRHVAVLISDIRDFTAMCEGMAPEQVVELLNSYLTEMTEAIKPWNGYVNNFLGDAMIVLFGVPESHPDPSGAAIGAAFEMRERLGQFNIRQEKVGKPILRSGTAIATGTVIAGQMGSIERFQYTVIGDAVNVAARLETLTKDYIDNPILISEATKADIKQPGNLQFVPMGEQMLKGRIHPVQVFAVYKPPVQTA